MNVFVLVILEFHPVGCKENTGVGNPPTREVKRNAVIGLSDVFQILTVKRRSLLPHVVRNVDRKSTRLNSSHVD